MQDQDWERLWAPYDEPTYQAVMAQVRPDDIVLEIGAGDLRLARRLAARARRVYAIERQPILVARAFPGKRPPGLLGGKGHLPQNLYAVCGDARHLPFPQGVTLGVLLMRHCRHFGLYADKLSAIKCARLITNARWHFGVESIDLLAPRIAFDQVRMGWYACWCGATGFVPGPAEQLTPAIEGTVHQVIHCPVCP